MSPKPNLSAHPDQPEWLLHVKNASVLKIKLG